MTSTMVAAAVAGPLLLAYVVACVRDPLRWGLPAYAVSIQFSSLVSVAPGPFGSVSSLLGMLLGIALLVQVVTSRRAAPRLSPLIPVWLGFLALTGFSAYWSVDPDATLEGFGVLASLVLLFVALAVVRFDLEALRRFENALLAGALLVVAYGLFQLVVLGGFPTPDGGAARFGNDLLGPNHQAASLLLPLAIAAKRALHGSFESRMIHGALGLLFLIGVLMTGSRAGLLASILVLGTVGFYGAARRVVVIPLLAAGLALMVVVLLLNPGGIGQRQVEETTDPTGRSEIWAVGLNACQDYCLTGAGWGSYPTVYRLQRASVPEARVLDRGTSFEAHNVYLLVAVETGVLGLLIVAVALGLTLVTALRLPKLLRGPPLAALVGTLVTSFFLSNLEFKYTFAVFMYVAACATVLDVHEQESLGRRAAGRRAAAGQDVR